MKKMSTYSGAKDHDPPQITGESGRQVKRS